ncbi:hypothetical protein OG279_26245 [Streptomyces sp. NBC_01201]|uniref:hypothetical protein n=1 Tax=unclassified Streptomyces TaxID=2593676 RepID=UPI002E1036D6|nr:hypothetical protein OG725_24495 [Streptomyces sp. NBC_01213]WSQ82788.1 hypothetical protein OG725_37440 [Streptomyces sp. NBC_01213]WSR50921.1 hypothetical protein OG279_26245 [Streptomyces sp. NBC_01201]
MSRGGARTVSGPPPDPRSMRSAKSMDKGGWRTLPAEGRSGEAPEWPLTEAAEREVELWDDLWAKPQAVAWEDMGQELEVALFVRTLAEAERADARLDVKKMVRGYLDSLGLSVAGMNRNRWKIAPAAEATEQTSVAMPARRPSARDRLKVVPSGEGA